MASVLRKPTSFLLVENPDDLSLLRAAGADPAARFAILGGSGIDPMAFPALPQPRNEVPVAAFVGHMTKPKGVDVLMDAYDRLSARGVRLRLELVGKSDESIADGVPPEALRSSPGLARLELHSALALPVGSGIG